MLKSPRRVNILVLNGSSQDAIQIAERRYPGCETELLSKRELREQGWKHQIRKLRSLRGEAFLVFVNSMETIQEPMLLKLTILFHGCRETVIADRSGKAWTARRLDMWKILPGAAWCAFADSIVFLASWVGLRLLLMSSRKTRKYNTQPPALDAAFLYPFPMDHDISGGAMSHVKGFLSGLAERSARTEIFSGRKLPINFFPVHEYPNKRESYLFRQSQALSYNLEFAGAVSKYLASRPPAFIYQRHGKFVVAGVLLSRRLRRPLVLEYNGSEVWISKHWDPTGFSTWLRLCEEVSLAAARWIVVVSDALRQELMSRGIAEERILLNPNAVDPAKFYPGCGGQEVRKSFGFEPRHVVVGFIGTFSYYHGVSVFQKAIQELFEQQEVGGTLPELRFLLVGDGTLAGEVRAGLAPYTEKGWVAFTGQIPHDQAPAHLDSMDILISPHVRMPDGTPFFGSPTKLFEYMATGKAIVASKLDQLAAVLTHNETAVMVEPGDAGELAQAIRTVAANAEMRTYLGKNAREAALQRHTWDKNAARVLACFAAAEAAPAKAMSKSVAAAESYQ